MGIVPYIVPGFGLAKAAAEVFDANPSVEGLILTSTASSPSATSAREAYERMIEMVTLAEERLRRDAQGGVRDRRSCRSGARRAGRDRADPARRLRSERRTAKAPGGA